MNTNTKPMEGAIFWIDRSFWPVPVNFRSKIPYNPDDSAGKNWQDLRITAQTAARYFNGAKQNIGVLLGDRYGSTDVDLDCLEAVSIAPYFLPATAIKFGRDSKPSSHWLYRIDPPIPSQTFTDPTSGTSLLELRCLDRDGSVGHQTVVPPSVHESGELIRFDPGFDGHPANVEGATLFGAAKTIAAAALLARYWPAEGAGRHETMLALAGVLQRAAWTEDQAVKFCIAVYLAVANHDPGAIGRTDREVRDTFVNAGAGRAVTGIPRLRQHFNKRVIDRVLEWLGVEARLHHPNAGSIIEDRCGNPRAILANGVTVLRSHDAWCGVLAFNEFTQVVHANAATPWGTTGVWNDSQDRLTADWLQRNCGIHLPIGLVSEAVQLVAMENGFDPLRTYLADLHWDGRKRIDDWLSNYLGAKSTPYTRAVGAKWLISAVARTYKPGCKSDCALILEGPQGLGKSSALRVLSEPWFTDELADLGTKDAAIQCLGVWVVEIAELDAMSRTDVSGVKAFLSRTTDRYRPPYGRRVVEQTRRCVFAGTVNASTCLRDATGNRRFWPVTCTSARLAELGRDRNQIWAEAVHQFNRGAKWWIEEASLLQDAEREQRDRLEQDPWQEAIEGFVASRTEVTTAEILAQCIGKESRHWGTKDEMRVGSALRALRWERQKRRIAGGGNKTEWCYRRMAD